MGSPPLLNLLQTVKPDYWFSAHLHVKFAAVFEHHSGGSIPSESNLATASAGALGTDSVTTVANPDEIDISDDFDDEPVLRTAKKTTTTNPDEITIEDGFDDIPDETTSNEQIVYKGNSGVVEDLQVDESADLVEQARKEGEVEATKGVIGTFDSTSPATAPDVASSEDSNGVTKFLALDKCGPGKDFIQVSCIERTGGMS